MAERHAGRRLSREEILDAALRVIDEVGLDKLTMRRLGEELGTDPMMVYRHFSNKAALLDGVMETIWQSVEVVPGGVQDGGWREQLVIVMHGLRQAFLAHPQAIMIIGTRPASGPGLFMLFERLLSSLVASGMRIDARTAELLNALVNYTVGHVLAEVGQPVGGEVDGDSHKGIAPALFPHLAAVFHSGWEYDPFRQFDGALRAMVACWGTEAQTKDGREQ